MSLWIVIGCGLCLAGAGGLAAIRLSKGPSTLDRVVALDLVVAVLMAAVAIESAWNRRTDTVPLLLALALVGFVGSVSVARFTPEIRGKRGGRRGP